MPVSKSPRKKRVVWNDFEISASLKLVRPNDSIGWWTYQKATIILYETLHDRYEAETKHIDGQPDMWSEALQEDIAGNLKEAIRHEEDSQGDIEVVASQV